MTFSACSPSSRRSSSVHRLNRKIQRYPTFATCHSLHVLLWTTKLSSKIPTAFQIEREREPDALPGLLPALCLLPASALILDNFFGKNNIAIIIYPIFGSYVERRRLENRCGPFRSRASAEKPAGARHSLIETLLESPVPPLLPTQRTHRCLERLQPPTTGRPHAPYDDAVSSGRRRTPGSGRPRSENGRNVDCHNVCTGRNWRVNLE